MARGLQALNAQGKMTEWAARISACRNSGQSLTLPKPKGRGSVKEPYLTTDMKIA